MDSPSLRNYNYDHFWNDLPKCFNLNIDFDEIASSMSPVTPKTEEVEVVKVIQPAKEQPKPRPRTRKPRSNTKHKEDDYKATKNLVKNYAKAITSFALSELAEPYLAVILHQQGLLVGPFNDYMKAAQDNIQSIDSFRNFLLVNDEDSVKQKALKQAFQEISILFIKLFSVNWIIHSRIGDKLTYLKYRYRILRRIQNPELFTYLRQPKAASKTKVKEEAKN